MVVILLLISFNLYFIKVLDSNLTQNYTNSITSTGSIVDRPSEEVETELQTKIVSWGDLIANNSNLFSLDNIISYPDDALVNVRDDNKMEFVVKRDTLEFSQEINEFLSKYNVEIFKDIPYFNASIIYTSVENLSEFMLESESTQGITYTEPNFYCELDFVPNDEYYESEQWDLSLIGMESAWEYELGSHDVIVAVVDTGIDYTHPDLSDNYLPLGYDWVNNDTDPMDDHFHGTHCAGTIAAIINNNIGIAGIANVSIFAEKSFNSNGSGSYVDSSLAIKHAVDMGANIISCSWGGTTYSFTLREAIDYALNHDVMVIAAAGNSNSDSYHYPAAYPGVIAVSATDQDDNKASFSNYGDWIDIAAPGVSILSTVPYYLKNTYYSYASGTSMATPHVSGLAALIMESFPTKNSSQIETLIYESAIDLGDPGFDKYYGFGRIDITTVFGPDTTPPKCSNWIESADPLILGNTEIITIDVNDPSGVSRVLIDFEDSNYSMINIDGNTWQYDSWTPNSTGKYMYTIYMEDNCSNWGAIQGSILVISDGFDDTPPIYSNWTESADPLILGNTEIITIDVSDPSGVNQVLIHFEGNWHSMINIGGNTWQYNSWIPSNIGINIYVLYMEDNFHNNVSIGGSIKVIEDDNDKSPPTYSNLVESADPLELGETEIISIEVYDPSGIKQILIEFEGFNHTMTNIGENKWQYNSWTPSSTGIYNYVIYMEDNYDNWGYVSGSINVKNDASPPNYVNLIESGDPLELGNTEIISIDVTDPSGIKQVLIEFEGFNNSMANIGGDTWQYNSWAPSKTGIYSYIIHMEDNLENWGSVSGSIQVLDTTIPSCNLLTNHTEPIELGNSTAILIKATDLSGIKRVIFQYKGINYIMMPIGGDVWQFKQFTPLSIGTCYYTIYVEDYNNNWGVINSSVEVVDTQKPNPPKLITFPSGNVSKQIVFDWEDGYDPSGIKFYRLIIDTELNPFLTPGFIFEVNISNSGSESSYFELDKSLSLGQYFFFIYQIDGVGHQSSPATGEFTVVLTAKKSPQIFEMDGMILLLTIIIIGSLVGIPGYIVMKKVKMEKKIKPLNKEFKIKNYNIQIKNLKNERVDLERKARNLVKSGNYSKASELYKQCKNISNDLFKFGIISEAEKAKYYANMCFKTLQIQNQEISFIRDNINAFLTEYYNKYGINYYSNPKIYPENQNAVNGLILNDAKFLHHILL
ncbi:MAG: S8 family peptidase, partial [Promethearchaeota archaeon]